MTADKCITILSQPQAVLLGDLQKLTTTAINSGISCGDVITALELRKLDLISWMTAQMQTKIEAATPEQVLRINRNGE